MPTKQKPEFTKKPWKASKSPTGDWVISAGDTLICREARHFNAHLIEAAPALYRAVEGLMKIAKLAMPTTYFQTDSRVRRARKALAKANPPKTKEETE